MNVRNWISGLSMMGFVTLLSGCGGSSIADSVHLVLDDDLTAKFQVEMSNGLEVHMDGGYDFLEGYGSVEFIPATQYENALISMELDLEKLAQDELDGYGTVSSLPNNAPFPVATVPPLVQIPVVEEGSVEVDALVSAIPDLQLGAFIKIDEFRSSQFPEGVAICQNFRNDDNYAFAAACLYGPLGNQAGGIYIGGNFGEVIDWENEGLFAQQSNTGLQSSTALMNQQRSLDRLEEVSTNEKAWRWREERYDPRRDLRGIKGYRALQRARSILSR